MSSRCLVIQVVAAESTAALLAAYAAADPRADLVELRLDLVRDLDLDRVLGAPGRPKLITVRSRQQGGGASAADRAAILKQALEARVEAVDLEFGGDNRPFFKGHRATRRILSFHDLQGTPADLPAILERMRAAARGALCKIAAFADAASDNLRLRDLLRTARPGEVIAFGMGPKGVPSRVLACHWGSAAVYAPARGAPASAPGQIPLEDLFELYRFDSIGPDTRLLGLLGSPVGHSLSPLMHNTALAALGLDFRYLPFEATTLGEFLPVLSDLRIHGLSVTIPYKEKILPYLDHLDGTARAVGAVNTVIKTWNRLEGTNTDVDGAIAALRGALKLRGARVAVLGAGGAARAVVHGLVRGGARVTIFNRTESRALDLADRFGAASLPWRRLRGFSCDLLVNATSVGLAPDSGRSPVPASWIRAPIVYDIIYNPPETLLLKRARRAGARTIGGVEMFVRQGAAQFRLFTGREAPIDLMRRAVLAALTAGSPEKPETPELPPKRAGRRPARR